MRLGFWPRTNCITVTLCPRYAWIKQWLGNSQPSLTNVLPKPSSMFFIIYFPSAGRWRRTLHRLSVPLSVLFAWGTIWHFHCSAVGMWELHWERSVVSRWPFCADSDIARWWEGSIVRVTPQPTLRHWDSRYAFFIQVKCQPFAGSKNSVCVWLYERSPCPPLSEQKKKKKGQRHSGVWFLSRWQVHGVLSDFLKP